MRAALLLLAALGLLSCDPGRVDLGRCNADSECEMGTVCVQGVRQCRPQSGCVSNKDCGLSFFCDSVAARCRPTGNCARDDHCALGAICAQGTCVAGCRKDADCNLGEICTDNFCASGRCNSRGDCGFGEYCIGATAEQAGTCQPSPAPLCQGCGQDAGACTRGGICFFDREGGRNACGSPCDPNLMDPNEDCPNGFSCGIIVNNRPCDAGCSGSCLVQEDGLELCACQRDSDCGTRACLRGSCDGTGGGCNSDADCGFASCIVEQGVCLIGFQCAPEQGRACF